MGRSKILPGKMLCLLKYSHLEVFAFSYAAATYIQLLNMNYTFTLLHALGL